MKKVVSFRIDDETEKKLRNIAERKKINQNALVNQIFEQYVGPEQALIEYGTIVLSNDAFDMILSNLTDKQILEIGTKIGETEPKQFILFFWKEINEDTVIKFFDEFFGYCGYGTCKMDILEHKTTITIHHHFKEKTSLYLNALVKAVISSCLNKTPDVQSFKNSILITL